MLQIPLLTPKALYISENSKMYFFLVLMFLRSTVNPYTVDIFMLKLDKQKSLFPCISWSPLFCLLDTLTMSQNSERDTMESQGYKEREREQDRERQREELNFLSIVG